MMGMRLPISFLKGGALAFCISLQPIAGFAQTFEPSASRGHQLGMRLCANCHLVDASGKSAPEGVGSFRGIANRSGQSAERISNVLMLPHMPMPDAQLTRDEIQDILAYLGTLRTNPDVSPLIVPQTSKPQYPSKG
jgi:cytochrome c